MVMLSRTLWTTLAFVAGMIFVASAGSTLAGGGDGLGVASTDSRDAKVQQLIADAFGVSPDEIADLHDAGIGYGAIVKLLAIAEAKGMSVSELVATLDVSDGEIDLAIGELIAGLTEEELAALLSSPSSLGPLMAEAMRPSFAGGDDEAVEAEQESNGHTDGGPGQGHKSCSEATKTALERLNELQDAGEPVGNAITAIEECGTGADSGAEPGNDALQQEGEDAGPPEGAGPPDWVPGPPPGITPGPPEGVPGGGEEGDNGGVPEGAGPPDWVPGPPPGITPGPPEGVPGDGEEGDNGGPPEGAGPPDWVPGPPPGVPGGGNGG